MDHRNHFVLGEVRGMGSLSHAVFSPPSTSHVNNIVYSNEPDTIIMEEDEMVKNNKVSSGAGIATSINYSADLTRLPSHGNVMDGVSQTTSLGQPGFIAMKPQTVNDVLLESSHVRQVLFNDASGNDMIVQQNVEVRVPGDNPHGEIILVPNSMIKQEDIIEGGEVVVGSSVGNEIIIGDQNTTCRFNNGRFTVAEMSSDSGDDGGFDDSKLVIDTSCIGMDENVGVGFDCAECGSVLKSKASLKRHVKNCHGKDKQAYKKSPKKKKDGTVRVEGSPSNKMYTCPSCSYVTKRRDKLDRHVQNHVLLEGYHPCGKKRKSRIDVPPRRHRHNAEEYKCHLCPYSCTVYKALKKHRKLHSSGHSFTLKISCKICGKDRPTEADSQKHMLKHRNGEYFMCDLCNFSSIQLKKIIQHRRMHTGEKPHLCPHCNYRSARRDNLRSHVRRMHKVENMYIDTFNPV